MPKPGVTAALYMTSVPMKSLTTPSQNRVPLTKKLRKTTRPMTASGLSERSGVALSTLRKFEQSGAISVDNLFKLMLVLGGLDDVIKASALNTSNLDSIDEVLSRKEKPKRKRGFRS